MDVRVGLWRRLSTKELMLLNCGIGEDSWESLGLQGDPYQSILKEIIHGISLEGMMLKLKLQYFGNIMLRVDSLEKTLMLGGIGGKGRRGRQRMRWLDGITDSMGVSLQWTPGVGDGQGGLACCDSWGRKESDTTEWLNWTELNYSCRWKNQKSTYDIPIISILWIKKPRLRGVSTCSVGVSQNSLPGLPSYLCCFYLLLLFSC